MYRHWVMLHDKTVRNTMIPQFEVLQCWWMSQQYFKVKLLLLYTHLCNAEQRLQAPSTTVSLLQLWICDPDQGFFRQWAHWTHGYLSSCKSGIGPIRSRFTVSNYPHNFSIHVDAYRIWLWIKHMANLAKHCPVVGSQLWGQAQGLQPSSLNPQ